MINPETKKEEIVDKIHIGHYGRVLLPKIPENLIPQPTLIWLL